MALDDVKPYPKETQLARAGRRYHRKVASPRRWQQIADAKQGPCRVTGASAPNELAHLVSRAHGGADTESNIVPLSSEAHARVHARDVDAVTKLLASLSDAEYSYCVERGGEGFFEQAYGLRYQRAGSAP